MHITATSVGGTVADHRAAGVCMIRSQYKITGRHRGVLACVQETHIPHADDGRLVLDLLGSTNGSLDASKVGIACVR